MEIEEAMRRRHSVRSYTNRQLGEEEIAALNREIEACNREGGVNFQLAVNEDKAFGGMMAHYGKFKNVKNYVALVCRKGEEEKLGYYGERVALRAQTLGLNTCWVALTFSKRKTACKREKGEKLVCSLALGYGETQGVAHKGKTYADVSAEKDAPDWFQRGVEAALLAPTAMNQQKFCFSLQGNEVGAEAGRGFYTKVDLGIAKLHFELGAGVPVAWRKS